MQSDWAPAHCDALRKLLASSLSYSEIAAALNAISQTAYSRSAVIGRAKRMGLAGTRSESRPKAIAGGTAAKPAPRAPWGQTSGCADSSNPSNRSSSAVPTSIRAIFR